MKGTIMYKAYYEDTGQIIYEHQKSGNLVGLLPLGTTPMHGSVIRTDGGDPWQEAWGYTPSGRKVIIEKE